MRCKLCISCKKVNNFTKGCKDTRRSAPSVLRHIDPKFCADHHGYEWVDSSAQFDVHGLQRNELWTLCFQLVGEARRCVSCPLCRGKCSSCSARHECLTGAGIFNPKPNFNKAAEPTFGRNSRPAHENFYRSPAEQPDGLSQGFAAVAISANPPHFMSWTSALTLNCPLCLSAYVQIYSNSNLLLVACPVLIFFRAPTLITFSRIFIYRYIVYIAIKLLLRWHTHTHTHTPCIYETYLMVIILWFTDLMFHMQTLLLLLKSQCKGDVFTIFWFLVIPLSERSELKKMGFQPP